MDAAPVFEPSEHVLDLVALLVEGLVVVDLDFPVGLWRDAGRDPPFGEGLAEPVGVIAFVAEQGPGFRESLAHLAFAEQHDQRPAAAVADGVELGVQATFGAPDTSGKSPFLSRLAAVR